MSLLMFGQKSNFQILYLVLIVELCRMNDQALRNYERIEKAIVFIHQHVKRQPSLEEIAEHVNLSPFHFQRLFQEWAGTSPKRFLQYLRLTYAKSLLKSSPKATLFDAAYELEFSSTSRLHDLFVRLEAMSPAEYRNEGKSLTIEAAIYNTMFGRILVANTTKGICWMAFGTSDSDLKSDLIATFPQAHFIWNTSKLHEKVLAILGNDALNFDEIRLHLKGSPFQFKVWEALLKIPAGSLKSYQMIATEIQQTSAARAVGTAIGSNPIAYLIPCHRVIQTNGNLGGYRWGMARKSAILAKEAIQLNEDTSTTG